MWQMLEFLSAGVFLLIQSLVDWKKRRILVWYCLVQWGIACWLMLLVREESEYAYPGGIWTVIDLVFFALPGVLIFLAAFLTDEIGGGDGLVLISLSPILGIWKQLGVLFLAFLLVVAAGLLQEGIRLFRRQKTKRNMDYPFVPFLLVAYLLLLFWIY